MTDLAQARASARGPRDRRVRPRVPANMPVLIMIGPAVVAGGTTDASEGGLGVAVPASAPLLPSAVRIALRLPSRGWQEVDAEIVRREPLGAESTLLGFRLPGRGGGERPTTPLHRGRAIDPRPGRPVAFARTFGTDLRAIAALAYEQAFDDPAGQPLAALVTLAGRLSSGLGMVPGSPATNRDFLHGVAALHRRLSAVPAGPSRSVAGG
jgi:PilZ domain-containing protein